MEYIVIIAIEDFNKIHDNRYEFHIVNYGFGMVVYYLCEKGERKCISKENYQKLIKTLIEKEYYIFLHK